MRHAPALPGLSSIDAADGAGVGGGSLGVGMETVVPPDGRAGAGEFALARDRPIRTFPPSTPRQAEGGSVRRRVRGTTRAFPHRRGAGTAPSPPMTCAANRRPAGPSRLEGP